MNTLDAGSNPAKIDNPQPSLQSLQLSNSPLYRLDQILDIAHDYPQTSGVRRIQVTGENDFRVIKSRLDSYKLSGVDAIYLSPIMTAKSEHGYDTVNPTEINPAYLGEEAFIQLCNTAKEKGINVIVDIVPNHMRIGPENVWLKDVLLLGQASQYASYFTIRWDQNKNEDGTPDRRIVIPVLGCDVQTLLGSANRERNIQLAIVNDELSLQIYKSNDPNSLYPLNDRSLLFILEKYRDFRRDAAGNDRLNATLRGKLDILIGDFEECISSSGENKDDARAQCLSQFADFILNETDHGDPFLTSFLDHINTNIDILQTVLDAQHYRLEYWKAEDLYNTQAFFEIYSEYIQLAIEKPEVFEAYTAKIAQLIKDGHIQGVRIDHIDGLRDPQLFIDMLQEKLFICFVERDFKNAPEEYDREFSGLTREQIIEQYRNAFRENDRLREDFNNARNFLILTEKVLADDNDYHLLRTDGDTGYRALAIINGLFVNNTPSCSFFSRFQRSVTISQFKEGTLEDGIEQYLYSVKKGLAETRFKSVFTECTRLFLEAVEGSVEDPLDNHNINKALIDFVSSISVYRINVNPRDSVSTKDVEVIENAIAKAKEINSSNTSICDTVDMLRSVFLKDTANSSLSLTFEDGSPEMQLVQTLQTIMVALEAKAREDTLYYAGIFTFPSLLEVGCDVMNGYTSITSFHDYNAQRLVKYPNAISTLCTHDSKSGADARGVVNALGEYTFDFIQLSNRLLDSSIQERTIGEKIFPDKVEFEFILSRIISVWSCMQDEETSEEGLSRREDFIQNVVPNFVMKAINEGKVNSNWYVINHEWIQAATVEVQRLLRDEHVVGEIEEFYNKLKPNIVRNCISQELIKITIPGIPDFYAGDKDGLTFYLVDPHNRTAINAASTATVIEEVATHLDDEDFSYIQTLIPEDGNFSSDQMGKVLTYIKIKALNFRREHNEVFAEGSEYIPVYTEDLGGNERQVISFMRQGTANEGAENKLTTSAIIVASLKGRLQDSIAIFNSRESRENHPYVNVKLMLPNKFQGTKILNIFTGEEIEVQRDAEEVPYVMLSDALSYLPVAELVSVEERLELNIIH
jgi:(1->4)-alpha-D-glucan 1-alpha-D-glucosylmutase